MTGYAMAHADPTDVMGRRIGAYVIDTVIAIIIVVAVAVPAFSSTADRVQTNRPATFCDSYRNSHSGGFCFGSGGTTYTLTATDVSRVSQLFYAAAIGWTLLNAILLQGITGGTVGKLLLGLRVVRSDGRRAGIGWCALRTVLLLLIDALCFIIGLVVSLSSVGHRRVGDMAASTLVVPKEYEGQPFGVPGLTGPAAPGGGYGPPPAGRQHDGVDGPTWDAARNAYLHYDRETSAWLQWNDSTKQWTPIDQA